MSRADQSLSRHRPNTCDSASAGETGRPAHCRTDEDAHFQFVVQALAGAERGSSAGGLELAHRAAEALAGDADGRRAAVIADRHPLVVGQQRDCRAGTACRPWWRGGSRCRNRCSRRCVPARRIRPRPAAPAPVERAGAHPAAAARQGQAQCDPGRRAQGHQGVQAVRAASSACGARGSHRPSPRPRTGRQVEDLVADGHAAAEGSSLPAAEHAEGQVLDREVGAGRYWRRQPSWSGLGRGFR
jgi:hypothetical protein